MSKRSERRKGGGQGDDRDAREPAGRDAHADDASATADASAERAGTTRVPMPNEEGSNFRAGHADVEDIPDVDAQGDGDAGREARG